MKVIKVLNTPKNILKKLHRFCRSRTNVANLESDLDKSKTINVSFTGGMGAQIFSSAIFFYLKMKGYSVRADLEYFNKDYHLATVGNKGEISHWDWQLDKFGLTKDVIRNQSNKGDLSSSINIVDGPLKLSLAMQALKLPDVKKYFNKPKIDDINMLSPEESFLFKNNVPYICIHIRRGDYVNVATHIVPDGQFIKIAKQLKCLIDSIVIVSDSTFKEEFHEISNIFLNTIFLDSSKIDAFLTHSIMRNSNILVCSNSQYSLSAGLLHDGLVIIPKDWVGNGHELLKVEIDKLSNFAVLK